MSDPASVPPASSNDADGPGLPFLKTWAAVYWLVFVAFVLIVILLALFSHYFTRTGS